MGERGDKDDVGIVEDGGKAVLHQVDGVAAQYTRPVEFEGLEVPEVLRNGNHALINRWRRKEALKATYLHRPDLLAELGKEDVLLLNEIKQELAGDHNG